MSKKTQNAALVILFNIPCFFNFKAHCAIKNYIICDLHNKAIQKMRFWDSLHAFFVMRTGLSKIQFHV